MGSFYFALGLDTLFGPFDALDFMINSPYCRHHLSNDLAVKKWCLIKHYSLNDIFLSSDLFTGSCCTDVEEVFFSLLGTVYCLNQFWIQSTWRGLIFQCIFFNVTRMRGRTEFLIQTRSFLEAPGLSKKEADLSQNYRLAKVVCDSRKFELHCYTFSF